MLIRLLSNYQTGQLRLQRGDTASMSDARAKALIEQGKAEKVPLKMTVGAKPTKPETTDAA